MHKSYHSVNPIQKVLTMHILVNPDPSQDTEHFYHSRNCPHASQSLPLPPPLRGNHGSDFFPPWVSLPALECQTDETTQHAVIWVWLLGLNMFLQFSHVVAFISYLLIFTAEFYCIVRVCRSYPFTH